MFKERLLQKVVEDKQAEHLKVRCRVLQLAGELGIPLDIKREMDIWLRQSEPRWNGKTIIANPSVANGDLLHDMAHWMVASKTARKRPEFGLGTSFKGPYILAYYEPDTCTRLECKASLLGISLEVECGRDPDENLDDHNWLDNRFYQGKSANIIIRNLREEFPRFEKPLKTVIDRLNFLLKDKFKNTA